jgi:GNAT superfamily N-acetyltransferase
MRIRRAREDELQIILKHRIEMTTSMRWTQEQVQVTRDSTEKKLKNGWPKGFHCYFAEIDGKIVGGCSIVVFDILPSYVNTSGRVAYVQNMFVEPEHRGKGIGRDLVQHIEEEARNLNVSIIWLHATELGRPVYEKEGYRVWKPFYRKEL